MARAVHETESRESKKVCVCECVTLNSPSKAEWGETLLYFSPFWTCPVASLHTRHLFLEVGVHVSVRFRLLESSLGLLILGMVHRKVAAAAAVQDCSRTSELFIWPSDPYRVTSTSLDTKS